MDFVKKIVFTNVFCFVFKLSYSSKYTACVAGVWCTSSQRTYKLDTNNSQLIFDNNEINSVFLECSQVEVKNLFSLFFFFFGAKGREEIGGK